jgi:hypothetical protein
VAYVLLAFGFGLAGGYVGKIKGSSFWLWFLISGLVPVFGLLAAIAYRFEREELRRQCPRCGRVTKIYDALCMRCGAELEFPDVAIAPESWERDRERSPYDGPPGTVPTRTADLRRQPERIAPRRRRGASEIR